MLELLEGGSLLKAGAMYPTFNPGGPIPGAELNTKRPRL